MMMTLRGSDMERQSSRWSVCRQPIVGEEDSRPTVTRDRRPPRSGGGDGGAVQLAGGATGQYVGLAMRARRRADHDHHGLAVVERGEQLADAEPGARHRWLAADRPERGARHA